jgi:hypothetical protein
VLWDEDRAQGVAETEIPRAKDGRSE